MRTTSKGMGPVITAIVWMLVAVVLAAGFYFFSKMGAANRKSGQAGSVATETGTTGSPTDK